VSYSFPIVVDCRRRKIIAESDFRPGWRLRPFWEPAVFETQSLDCLAGTWLQKCLEVEKNLAMRRNEAHGDGGMKR